MTIKSVGGTNPVRLYPKPAYGKPGWPFLIANLDLTNTLYVDTNTTINNISDQIPPLGTMGFDGTTEVYASTLNTSSIRVQVIRGGTSWDSGPALAAESISALGLATAELQNTQMSTGIPPNVPNVTSSAQDNLTPGTYTLATFADASRLWYGSISLALATSSDYASDLMRIYAQLLLGADVIMITQGAIGGTGEAVTDHCDFSFGGLEIPPATDITVNVNGGTGGITGLFIAAAAVVMTSTP